MPLTAWVISGMKRGRSVHSWHSSHLNSTLPAALVRLLTMGMRVFFALRLPCAMLTTSLSRENCRLRRSELVPLRWRDPQRMLAEQVIAQLEGGWT